MASPKEKLAKSLKLLQGLQREDGSGAIRSRDLPRVDRERLQKNGFIKEVMKGWYVPSRVDETRGESTAWYASFWPFVGSYLNERFGENWSLSPEQSLSIHTGNWSVPRQLLVRSAKAGNKILNLPHETSILDIRAKLPDENDVEVIGGLRLFSLEAALIAATPTYFRQSPTDARAALSMLRDASTLLSRLLEGGHSHVSGRMAGAFRNIGRPRIADDIIAAMDAAGYIVRETDPFETTIPASLHKRDTSPYVTRLKILWQDMRKPIIISFPPPAGRVKNVKYYLEEVNDIYVTDAYHSLSIEGYRVTTDLIEQIRNGDWDPDNVEADRNQRDAMAARGYMQAFQAVQKSVHEVLSGKNAGEVADKDHGIWYRELFSPSVAAGILHPTDLAGYRENQVFIQASMHVPMMSEAVPDAMTAFFELLTEEEHPAVRVVLGHFFFVYIHPYMDGNGRIGRFLMNLMLASGGYPWTVIPVENRTNYMDALEEASIRHNIVPFSKFITELVKLRISG